MTLVFEGARFSTGGKSVYSTETRPPGFHPAPR